MTLSAADKIAIRRWQHEAKSIRRATTLNIDEKPADKEKRIVTLLDDPIAFFKYYFPHYCTAEFADFQIAASNKIISTDVLFSVLEWARGHSKSSTVLPMIVAYLTFKEKDVNLLLVSYNEVNAIDLLKPIKLEFENNQRIINDFGTQKSLTDWDVKKFVTTGGCSFRAIGSGQSPRGTKEQEVRPNIIICDDLDEDEMLRNPRRLDQTWEWVTGALYNCFDIKGKKRFILINNRIAKDCCLARAAAIADYHLQVNALKKAKTKTEKEVLKTQLQNCKTLLRKEADEQRSNTIREAIKYLNDGYIPSWHQRYTMLEVIYVRLKIGYRMFEREYMNNPIAEGKVFKDDWLQDKKMLPLTAYSRFLIGYLDPGFKNKKTSDSKSWVLVGLHNAEYHIIKAYCDRASVNEMILWGYDMHNFITAGNGTALLQMEEVFLQDLLYKDFSDVAKTKKQPLPLMGDKRKKPDKDARIASISGYFERGCVYFNIDEANNHHMLKLKEQFLNFEQGVNTLKDGCDAVEGAIFLLNQMVGLNTHISFGKPFINTKRV